MNVNEMRARYAASPEVKYLTKGTYENTVGNVLMMLKKISVVEKMGAPVNKNQEIAFGILADVQLGEEEGGLQIGASVLGTEVGRLERNRQRYYNPEEYGDAWETAVLKYLEPVIEKVVKTEQREAFTTSRKNVLYGTWRHPDEFELYLYMLNHDPDAIDELMHE